MKYEVGQTLDNFNSELQACNKEGAGHEPSEEESEEDIEVVDETADGTKIKKR